ncbi:MAG: hypothetical protein NVSMB6_22800 [Burkholderiaceae bacterium]
MRAVVIRAVVTAASMLALLLCTACGEAKPEGPGFITSYGTENTKVTYYPYRIPNPNSPDRQSGSRTDAGQTWKAITSLGGLIQQTGPDASDTIASIYAIHTDHLGTPQAVTDEEQQIVWQADTTPLGMATIRYAALMKTGQNNGNANAKQFEMNLRLPGQVYDAETGLHQNYYRDYDPQLGRYITPDPMGIEGGINPYSYVSNNPLTNVDALGLFQRDIHYYMTFF